MKSKVIDIGQTCLTCVKCTSDHINKNIIYCKEYDRVFHSVKYICKNYEEIIV